MAIIDRVRSMIVASAQGVLPILYFIKLYCTHNHFIVYYEISKRFHIYDLPEICCSNPENDYFVCLSTRLTRRLNSHNVTRLSLKRSVMFTNFIDKVRFTTLQTSSKYSIKKNKSSRP